jgi:hypothetical protein
MSSHDCCVWNSDITPVGNSNEVETYTVSMVAGYWSSEVSWQIDDQPVVHFNNINDDYGMPRTVSLASGTHDLWLMDSFGDGWNGASLTFHGPSGNTFGPFGDDFGYGKGHCAAGNCTAAAEAYRANGTPNEYPSQYSAPPSYYYSWQSEASTEGVFMFETLSAAVGHAEEDACETEYASWYNGASSIADCGFANDDDDDAADDDDDEYNNDGSSSGTTTFPTNAPTKAPTGSPTPACASCCGY